MNVNNFIYLKEEALSEDCCKALIDECVKQESNSQNCENPKKFGETQFRNGSLGRKDFSVYMPQESTVMLAEVLDCIFDGLDEYKQVITSVPLIRLISAQAKLQHTPVNGGFHQWHIEQSGGRSSSRALAWMIYLNDVERGGETEFLYQQIKVQPKQGSLVIWPAGVTHPHRGNPPYSNDKWIITGWFELPQYDVYDEAINLMAETQRNKDG